MASSGTKDLFAYAHDNRPSLVYVATCAVDGKRYVGVTRLTMEKRRNTHFSNARRGHRSKFYAAIRFHGEHAFSFIQACACDTYKGALALERKLISELLPEYNLTSGGEGVLGHRHSVLARRKMSAAKNGNGPWLKGECPQSVREKLSASARARSGKEKIDGRRRQAILANAAKANDSRRRPVVCINDGLAYPSTISAGVEYGISRVAVLNVCAGRYPATRRGLKFVFADEVY